MRTLCAAVVGAALFVFAAPAAWADSAGLVGAYGFEEATGTAAIDSSGTGNAGVFNGATRSASGRFGAAASFDGVNDRIDVADSNSLDLATGMTLEAWVRPTALGWRTAILKERTGGLAYGLYGSTDTNRPSAEIQAETRAPSAIATNLWTHLAATYDGATLRLYVNGGQVSSRAVTGPITVSSNALRIGGNAVWGEYFKGLIDEVRIYNRALAAGEIQTDMNTAVVSPDAQAPTAAALTAALTADDVHLSWSGATDNVGITGYRVFRDGTLLTTLAASATSYDDLDRPYGSYRYTVRAIDAAGNVGALSNEAIVNYVDPDAGPPTAPVVTASIERYDLHLTWTPSTDDLAVKEYRVYRGAQLMATLSPTTTEWVRQHISYGTDSYRVEAVDNAGHITSSAPVPVVLDVATTPPVPVFEAGCNGAKVHQGVPIKAWWPNPSTSPGTAWIEVDGNVVWGPQSFSGGAPSFTWRSWLETNGPHVMKMHVRTAAGTEYVSAPCEWNVVDLDVTATLAAPANGATVSGIITLDADVFSNGERDVSDWSGWYPAQDPIGMVNFVIDGYPGFNPIAHDAPWTATLDTRSLTNGPHTIKAEAFWGAEGWVRAASETITVNVNNSPTRPRILSATATGDDVLVTWEAVTADPPVTSYRVLRNDTQIATVTGTSTSYTDADLPNGTYSYRVAAVSPEGDSGPSNPVTATVNVDRTAPTVTLDAGCDGRTLSEYVGPINGTATDNSGGNVTVRVLVDDTTIWGPNTFKGAFHFDWDTRTFANGPHTMKVIARDAAGNETVKDCPWVVSNSALTVPISGAADGDTVSGTVALGFQPRADGAAATAPAFLQIDGATVANTASGPYAYSWDTTQVANGVHTIKASMYWRDYPNPMATATIQVTVNNAPPPSGLVAAYGFEQTSGTNVTDSSGKGSTGTLSGAAWAADGRFGRALSFDGVNDIVTVPDSNLLDLAPGMTLEAWVKPTTANGWRTVLLKERPGQLTYGLYATGDNGRPLAEVAAGAQRDARGTAALPVGVWTHLAATYDKSTLRLYVNGTQVSSTAVTGTLLNSTGALRIGGNTVWGEYFSGLIDEVRVYERALSAAEIAADKDRAV